MSPRKTKADHYIYQLKIALRDAKPPIWRRVQVPSDSKEMNHERCQRAV